MISTIKEVKCLPCSYNIKFGYEDVKTPYHLVPLTLDFLILTISLELIIMFCCRFDLLNIYWARRNL